MVCLCSLLTIIPQEAPCSDHILEAFLLMYIYLSEVVVIYLAYIFSLAQGQKYRTSSKNQNNLKWFTSVTF